jgi:hypothetical protein
MNSWLPTFPLLARPSPLSGGETSWPDYDGWSIAELLRGERFAPPPTASPMSSAGASAEQATVVSQPAWLAGA